MNHKFEFTLNTIGITSEWISWPKCFFNEQNSAYIGKNLDFHLIHGT
jgi:hypothetical protein